MPTSDRLAILRSYMPHADLSVLRARRLSRIDDRVTVDPLSSDSIQRFGGSRESRRDVHTPVLMSAVPLIAVVQQ
jgi:hypothetical protein